MKQTWSDSAPVGTCPPVRGLELGLSLPRGEGTGREGGEGKGREGGPG